MTPDTVEAARTAQNLLSGPDGLFQPERVRDETFKLLSQNEPVRALRLLVALDLLNGILPYPMPDGGIMAQLIRHVERFSQLETIISPRRNDNTASDVVLGLAVMVLDRWRAKLQEHLGREITGERPYLVLAILAALTPSSHEDAGPLWADHLRLSNEEAKIITRLIGAQKRISDRPPLDARSIHRYYREYGEAGVTGVLLWLARFIATSSTGLVDPVEWSNRLDNVAAPLLDAFFRHHQQIVSPPPFLTGEDLMQELSLPPGPVIGKLLTELLEAQAAGEITSRGDALAHARDMLGS